MGPFASVAWLNTVFLALFSNAAATYIQVKACTYDDELVSATVLAGIRTLRARAGPEIMIDAVCRGYSSRTWTTG